jgi:hypothetical protein
MGTKTCLRNLCQAHLKSEVLMESRAYRKTRDRKQPPDAVVLNEGCAIIDRMHKLAVIL